ncbi:MAG: hypothetical protein ACOC0J_01590, partial [Myxococcota bacterium]
MRYHRRNIVLAHGLLAAAAFGWLLWPLSGGPPWREEVPREERNGRLLGRAGPNTPGSVAAALDILDPLDELADQVEPTEEGLRLYQDGEALFIPWSEEPGASLQSGGGLETTDGKPLSGLRILLDPGHHGGAWSEVEFRHFPVWRPAGAAG